MEYAGRGHVAVGGWGVGGRGEVYSPRPGAAQSGGGAGAVCTVNPSINNAVVCREFPRLQSRAAAQRSPAAQVRTPPAGQGFAPHRHRRLADTADSAPSVNGPLSYGTTLSALHSSSSTRSSLA